jgi:hypothetical protein
MHTDTTLTLMEAVTTKLGQDLRKFRDQTCTAFATFELPREAAARNRRKQKAQPPKDSTGLVPSSTGPTASQDVIAPVAGPSNHSRAPPTLFPPAPDVPIPPPKERRRKKFNMATYKFHALGDYVQTIRMFGTTDSYSTQTVSSSNEFCVDL